VELARSHCRSLLVSLPAACSLFTHNIKVPCAHPGVWQLLVH
jgi:hypothetical protein